MDRKRAKELLPFIQALADGKTIQVFGVDHKWHDELNPDFTLKIENYRVKPEIELMTKRQLAEWCVKGNGQFRFKEHWTIYTEYSYDIEQENNVVSNVLIRCWGSDEWIEPTLEVYLEDCGKGY